MPVVDLRDDRTLSSLGLDARISVGDDYGACREWTLALHEGRPEACGIAYAARWGGVRTTNVALFPERCGEYLSSESLGRLGDSELEDLLLEAADRYNLTITYLA